jgi:hypothetical protein
MVTIAGCLGLRVSEIDALQREGFDFDRLSLLVQRGVANGSVDEVKAEHSVVAVSRVRNAHWLRRSGEASIVRSLSFEDHDRTPMQQPKDVRRCPEHPAAIESNIES